MSVQVKTPTKAQFEITEFPCGDRTPTNRTDAEKIQTTIGNANGESNQQVLQSQMPGGLDPSGRTRRRRNTISERPSHSNNNSLAFKRRFGKQGREKKMVLPTKFLLGGNIGDPLNLNSLCDEAVNKALNENTPVNSPLPLPPHRQQVQVLIPANINDPLNLTGEDVDLVSPKGNKKKRNKHKHKRKGSGTDTNVSLSGNEVSEKEEVVSPVKDFTRPIAIEITEESPTQTSKAVTCLDSKLQKIVDKIVSPVIPQMSPKSRNKRKRTTSDSKSDASGPSCKIPHKEETEKSFKSEKSSSPIRPKRQTSNQAHTTKSSRPKKKPKVFIYGNYNRYYGYRNPEMEDDPRLKCFVSDWFQGKDVLDIGCNVGHVTLAIAHDHEPRKIVGIDIDGQLIAAARRNVRHYLSHEITNKYPVSMETCYGPVAAPEVCKSSDAVPKFPENVSFLQSNYVLEKNELLDLVREEYDVILALSITKWWHLNFGDDGLKRAFKRIFRQLRPGGKLILEPQSWASYKKKKKLTEEIHKTYQSIKFRPSQFSEYLMSREVGFSTCETIDMPFNRHKGFQRPIQIYTKADTCFNTPLREYAISRSNTPHIDVPLLIGTSNLNTPIGTPRSDCATPQFTVGSGNVSPNTDIDSSVCTSCIKSPSSQAVTPNKTPVYACRTPENLRPLCDIKSMSAPAMLVTDSDVTKPDMTLKETENQEKALDTSKDPK